MGKFKNKKVVIKTMDWNEKGDLLINGRPALKDLESASQRGKKIKLQLCNMNMEYPQTFLIV